MNTKTAIASVIAVAMICFALLFSSGRVSFNRFLAEATFEVWMQYLIVGTILSGAVWLWNRRKKISREQQKGIVFALLAGVVILGGIGYFGLTQYQNYQRERAETEQQIKELLIAQQTELEKIAEEKQSKELRDLVSKQQNEINKLSEENEKRQEADLLEKCAILNSAIDRLNAGCPANLIKPPSQTITTQSNDFASVIKKWRPRVAFIDCKFVFEGNNMGEQSGSGYVLGSDTNNGNIIILTSDHVIDVAIHYLDGELSGISATPTSCDIKIPGDSQFVTVYNDGKGENPFSSSREEDFGLVSIKTPTLYMRKIGENLWDGRCEKKAELGEKILVLGYPGIGDQNDVTVTDGIISGYDGDYYITSAKVEHGNSGGIAVSLQNDCYLGIPTFVQKGTLESLARILNINVIFPSP